MRSPYATMDIGTIEADLRKVPISFEPLLLSFCRPPLRVVAGAAVVGSDGGTELRVALANGGVVAVDPSADLPERFVNSSLGQMARCIAAYASCAEKVVANATEAEARELVDQLRAEISSIDAAAIGDSEAWWAVILEQAEDGLL